MKTFLFIMWGGWLGVALSGTVLDWYWWVNVVGLNVLLSVIYNIED